MDKKNQIRRWIVGGLLLSWTAVSGAFAPQYSYDGNSNVLSVVKSTGEVISFQYDMLNRLSTATLPDGGEVTYTYSAAGLRTQMSDPHGTTYYSWDERGRLTGVQRAGMNPTFYTYDNNNRITAIQDPANRIQYYTYDSDGRLVTSQDSTGFNVYSYDGPSGLLQTHHRLRLDQTIVGATSYGYDSYRRLVQVTHYNESLAAKAQYTYSYDANGNVTQAIRAIPGETEIANYEYDGLDRLTQVSYTSGQRVGQFEVFTYDSAGNLTSRSTEQGVEAYSYGPDNRLDSINGPEGLTTLTYDANGNLVTKAGPQGTITYTFDVFDRLVGWSDGTNQVAYTYDGDGYRLARTVNGQTTIYAQDILAQYSRVLLETNESYGVTRLYNYGLALTSQIDATGTAYHLYDKLGRSVVELELDGNTTVARYKYTAFGVPEKLGTVSNDYQYTGEAYDETAGLIYLRSRYYDPQLARFISRDVFKGIMAQPQSLNRYAYVVNNPVNFIDPEGLLFTGLHGFSRGMTTSQATQAGGMGTTAAAAGGAGAAVAGATVVGGGAYLSIPRTIRTMSPVVKELIRGLDDPVMPPPRAPGPQTESPPAITEPHNPPNLPRCP